MFRPWPMNWQTHPWIPPSFRPIGYQPSSAVFQFCMQIRNNLLSSARCPSCVPGPGLTSGTANRIKRATDKRKIETVKSPLYKSTIVYRSPWRCGYKTLIRKEKLKRNSMDPPPHTHTTQKHSHLHTRGETFCLKKKKEIVTCGYTATGYCNGEYF